jgi:hypothetical protein
MALDQLTGQRYRAIGPLSLTRTGPNRGGRSVPIWWQPLCRSHNTLATRRMPRSSTPNSPRHLWDLTCTSPCRRVLRVSAADSPSSALGAADAGSLGARADANIAESTLSSNSSSNWGRWGWILADSDRAVWSHFEYEMDSCELWRTGVRPAVNRKVHGSNPCSGANSLFKDIGLFGIRFQIVRGLISAVRKWRTDPTMSSRPQGGPARRADTKRGRSPCRLPAGQDHWPAPGVLFRDGPGNRRSEQGLCRAAHQGRGVFAR